MTNNYNENTNPDYLGNESNLNQNSETSQVKHQTGDLTSNSIQTNEVTANNESNETLQSDYQSSESKENQNNEQSVNAENLTQQANQTNIQNYNYNNYYRNVVFSLPTSFEDYVKLS